MVQKSYHNSEDMVLMVYYLIVIRALSFEKKNCWLLAGLKIKVHN